MFVRNLTSLSLLLAALGFAGCSGGGPSSVGARSCSDASAFCVASCNLGCTATGGCAVTDIAQNQPLIFTFSQDVDPRSVNFSTFSLKTVNGQEPVGDFIVRGPTITFVPEVRTVQGQTFYGFDANQTYLLSLTGGRTAPAALLSTSGDRLAADYNCTLRVTRGVVDLDQRPPVARVVAPSTPSNVPRNTNVVLEFSELIDAGPFFGTSGLEAPIVYRVRRTAPNQSGVLSCDPQSREIVLSGTPRLENDTIRGVTVVTYQPPDTLPAEACLEVEVTSRVRDLAGTRATAQVFRFVTEGGNIQERVLEWGFQNDLELDRARSGGDWTNGTGTFAALGGDGRHGKFDVTDGQRVTDTYFVWSTDSQRIPRRDDALIEQEVTITDGRFFFTQFELPEGFTAEFRGSNPVQIFVRGECRILGRLVGNGVTVSGTHNGKNYTIQGTTVVPGEGQLGSIGGPGAGAGGKGAWSCDGTGNPNSPTNIANYNSFNGFHGEDLRIPAGHAYAGSEMSTGGRGSPLFPAHGNQSSLVFGGLGNNYAVEAASGAGGGGYVQVGETGICTFAGSITGFPPSPNTTPAHRGPNAPGGVQFPLLQFPASFVSSNYFLIGGSGGGGGSSQPVFSLATGTSDVAKYRSGGGGAGGGGAFLFRTGADLRVGSAARIEARGGSCDPAATTISQGTRGVPGPGGGGSGGSVVLQGSRGTSQQGTIDVSGGGGSDVVFVGFFNLDQRGGDGSPGFVRLERAGTAPSIAEIGTTVPPAGAENVGLLQEADTRVGFQSLWRAVGEVFPPIFVRYEVDADVDGVPTTFSDDPAVGSIAVEGQAPLNFWVQGTQVDPATGQPVPNMRPAPWRRYVGGFGASQGERSLNGDAPTGVRFVMILDRSLATNVVVRSVRIYFRS